MNTLKQYRPFLASAALMWVVVALVYPHYQYYVDPDGTAYLTISRRYAEGDFAKAINGYWSPWSCWLTALLMRCGVQAIPASIAINALGATGFLFISQSLFLRFRISVLLEWIFQPALALFLCYAVFDQSFDDLWECFFLLGVLRVIAAEDFCDRPALWVASGAIGALAYFAKAYSFPFFILNVFACTYFICRHNRVQWLKISFTAIAVMISLSLPWILALHGKYGIWTTSTAGPLNTSWYLVGHPYWKEGINYLLPPPYADSPYYWEDPYTVNGIMPHAWDSTHLAGMQLLRIGYNLLKLLKSMLQLSFLFFPAVITAVRFVAKNGRAHITEMPRFAMALSFLLFPAGYLLVNFEPRYIWYMVPLSMVAASLFIFEHINSNRRWMRWLPVLFALSYLFYPAYRMRQMYDEGKTDYEVAAELRRMNVHGSFTSIVKPGAEARSMERIAYFSGNTFYATPGDKHATFTDLLPELQRYGVKYFIIYDRSSYAFELQNAELKDGSGNSFPGVYRGLGQDKGGIKVFTLRP